MKKLFYLLIALPLAFFASCSNDDDLPQVDLTLTVSGVTQYDNAFYAVQGEEESGTDGQKSDADSEENEVPTNIISIEGLTAKSLTNKNATVVNAVYYLDGRILPPSFETSYVCQIPTDMLGIGTHTLSVTANVLQEDKSIANTALNFPLKIVANYEDLPAGAPEIGTYSVTMKMDKK